jgi:hypothetical protein
MSRLTDYTTLRTPDHLYLLMPTKRILQWKDLSDRSIRIKPPNPRLDRIQEAPVDQMNLPHCPQRLEVDLAFGLLLRYSHCLPRRNVKLRLLNPSSTSTGDRPLHHRGISHLGFLGRRYHTKLKEIWRGSWRSCGTWDSGTRRGMRLF